MMLELEEFLVIGGESSLLFDNATDDDPVESFLATEIEPFTLFEGCFDGSALLFDCKLSMTDEE